MRYIVPTPTPILAAIRFQPTPSDPDIDVLTADSPAAEVGVFPRFASRKGRTFEALHGHNPDTRRIDVPNCGRLEPARRTFGWCRGPGLHRSRHGILAPGGRMIHVLGPRAHLTSDVESSLFRRMNQSKVRNQSANTWVRPRAQRSQDKPPPHDWRHVEP